MIHEPVRVEHVAFELSPHLVLIRIGGLFHIIPVTTSLVTVFLPWLHTAPAKTPLAIGAEHVVATAVLLDRSVALGTVFGVYLDPFVARGVIAAPLQPLPEEVAQQRRVPFVPAVEAEGRGAAAPDLPGVLVLHPDRVQTPRAGTPAEQLVPLENIKKNEVKSNLPT